MLFFAACLLIAQSGCEYKAPASPWEESQKKEKILPVITQVEPAIAGAASEITLIGENFSPVDSLNKVYFDNVPAVIKSASATQIVVYRPSVVGDSLSINVTVAGALGIAKHYPYKLEAVVENYGHFAGLDALITGGMDKSENLYLAIRGLTVIRLNSDGSRDLGFTGTTQSSLWTELKAGPDGMIYMARSNNIVYRLANTGGAAEEYFKFPNKADRVKSLDFDENGNLYCGGKNSDLLVIRSQTDFQKMGFYADYEILCIRVFKGYVYLAANYLGKDAAVIKTAIWRNQILPDGTVGGKELVLDWSISPTIGATLNSFTFSENGVIYIASNDPETPVIMYDSGAGSFKTLFFGIIPSPVDQLIWGNSNYLYAIGNRNLSFDDGGKLLKINTGEKGAPYYGR
jgi:hypothetical protein